MEKNISINIDLSTKGIVVFAKAKNKETHGDWLVLISSVVPFGLNNKLSIYRYISYNINKKRFYFDNGHSVCWVKNDTKYDFFKATDEERKFIVSELSRRGYKFIKTLNKLIKR